LVKLRAFTSFYGKMKENLKYEPKIKKEIAEKFTEEF